MIPSEVILSTPSTLLVFIDETGNEDRSDPINPTFGRGGCAVLGSEYKTKLKKPWRQLKRHYLGGANKPFHARDFEVSKPAMKKITAINQFLRQKFWRFAAMLDDRTSLPSKIDAHKAVSLTTIKFISKVVAGYREIDTVALVFESSSRGDVLVERDGGINIEVQHYFQDFCIQEKRSKLLLGF